MCAPGVRVHRGDYSLPYEKVRGPTSIIEVRAAMEALATDIEKGKISPCYGARMLRNLAAATKRKPPVSVAPRRIRPLSDEQREKVRAYHRKHPDMSQLELANLFNTNPGRISEALNERQP